MKLKATNIIDSITSQAKSKEMLNSILSQSKNSKKLSKANREFNKKYSTIINETNTSPLNRIHKCHELIIVEDNLSLLKK